MTDIDRWETSGSPMPVQLAAIVDAIPVGATSVEAVAHIDDAMRSACRRRERWALDYMGDLLGVDFPDMYPRWIDGEEVPR